METLDEKLARLGAEAEEHRDDPIPPGTKITRGHGRTRTLPVQLNDYEYDQIEQLAQQRELPMSTLARSYLLKELASETGDKGPETSDRGSPT